MEPFLVLLGVVAVGWLLIGPILAIVMWVRVGSLERKLQEVLSQLAQERRQHDRQRRPTEVGEAAAPAVASVISESHSSEPVLPREFRPVPVVASQQPPVTVAASDIFFSDTTATPVGTTGAPVTTPADSAKPGERRSTFEEILAGQWLTWVGAIAVVIGTGFFFKFAVENQWIGPRGRILAGIVLGIACFAGGVFSKVRQYKFFGQGLAGAGVGILYLAIFSAFNQYHFIEKPTAFLGMIGVTAAALIFSARFDAQATAFLGYLGGLLTPVMLSTGDDQRWILFPYLLILDLGVLGVAAFRKWQPLQIMAFVGTLAMWHGWFFKHYRPEILFDTLVLMSIFFALFVLLSLFHNVLRRKQADSGDFFLIMVTPVVYFGGVYAVTRPLYSDWHGLMAVGMAGLYLGQALLARAKHPEGRSVIFALGGLAVSFLTLAVPLQMTGHWIAICWAAESVVLVAAGLRFGLPRLRLAGFLLLALVQGILVIYSLETLQDPRGFSTRFTKREIAATPSDLRPEPHWSEVFNGRSLTFLANAAGIGILAWEYRRRILRRGSIELREDPPSPLPEAVARIALENSLEAGWLLAGVPLSLLAMLLVESYAFGNLRDWLFPTFGGVFSVATALAATALVVLSSRCGPRWISRIALGVFALLSLLVLVDFGETLINWREDWSQAAREGVWPRTDALWSIPVFNPRGVGFLTAAIAGAFCAWLSRRNQKTLGESLLSIDWGELYQSAILGVFAYVTGLILVTAELYAQGIIRHWESGTSLAITLAWTLYAVATLVAGIYCRSTVVRILSLSLFLLTTLKVFLFDVWQLHAVIRTFAFVGLGAALLLVSFLYRRYRDRIRAWIAPVETSGDGA